MSFKDDAKSAAIMVATSQVFALAKKGVVGALEKLEQKKVANAVKSPAGSAGLSYGLSEAFKLLPKIGDSPVIGSMSRGLRVGALITLGNAAFGKLFKTEEKKEEEAKPPRAVEETEEEDY